MTKITGQSLSKTEEAFLLPRLEGIADSVHQLEHDNAELRRALRPSCCAKVTATLKAISLIAAGFFLKSACDYFNATERYMTLSSYDDRPLR